MLKDEYPIPIFIEISKSLKIKFDHVRVVKYNIVDHIKFQILTSSKRRARIFYDMEIIPRLSYHFNKKITMNDSQRGSIEVYHFYGYRVDFGLKLSFFEILFMNEIDEKPIELSDYENTKIEYINI